MSRICPQCLDAKPSDRSAQADVLLREEPDEEEDEEEDEGQRQVLDLGEINDSQKLCPKELVEIAPYIFAARIAEELLIGNERGLSPRGCYQSRN